MFTKIRDWLLKQGSPGGGTAHIRRVRGIPVELNNSRTDINSDEVISRLNDALELIERYQPHHFRRLSFDIRAIRVERFPTRGAFFPEERVILSELTFLARRDITAAPVASSILHEGVHARVHAFRSKTSGGQPWHSLAADSQAREERLCRRAELEFGRRLPVELGMPVIERAEASLKLTDSDVAPVINWSLAQARVGEIDRLHDQGSKN